MIVTTLVTGKSMQAREAAIAASLNEQNSTAIILEGIPSGDSSFFSLNDPHRVHISYIAPSCLCCTGNLTLRVTLNRLIRTHPERLFIGLATTEHIEQIRLFLEAAPYNSLLTLTKNLDAG